MAVPAETFTTFEAMGQKEDVVDMIYNVDPDDTPVLSAIAKTKAIGRLHEWQTDVLDTPSADNAHLEGDNTPNMATTPTVMLNNYTQIFKKTDAVSGTYEKVEAWGQGSKVTYQKLLRGKSLKNDMEMSLFANKPKNAGAVGTARELGGLGSWIADNVNKAGDGTNPVGDGTDARVDGTPRAFAEDQLKDVLKQVWQSSGATMDMIAVNGDAKIAISEFAGTSTQAYRRIGPDGRKHDDVVEYYAHDFAGSESALKVVPCRHVRQTDAWVLSTDYLAWAQLRPMFSEDLAKIGDSHPFHIIEESTLVVRNQKAHGLVADLP